MRIRGIGRLKSAARRVRGRFVGGSLILLYHRVAELPSDVQLLAVTPRHFAEHLEVLRQYYHPTRLRDLAGAIKDGSAPSRAVAITFDDGYADNLYNAKPLLERYDVPATVFVATGHIGEEREFWWDELDRLLLQPGELPETLHLCVNGKTHKWSFSPPQAGSWNVLRRDSPSPRHLAYRALHRLLRPLPERERQRSLDELRDWAGAASEGRPTHRVLTSQEVLNLAEGGLIEVGAHTATHPVLASLPVTEQRSEIHGGKARLEEILGRPVNCFSYPYGERGDYTQETVGLVREEGFTCACSNFPDVVWRRTDLFQLPRVVVRDWDGDGFARHLRLFLSGQE